eukprot:2612677-Pyramimonas_sp.AAC.1
MHVATSKLPAAMGQASPTADKFCCTIIRLPTTARLDWKEHPRGHKDFSVGSVAPEHLGTCGLH